VAKTQVRDNIQELNRITDHYQAALQSGIEANKRYPRRARRNRQQGRCTIGFTVLRNGTIRDIRIIHSSGHTSLDQASIRAVEATSGQYPFPDSIKRNEWAFTIPVQYQLR
jgi:protein TonB